MSRLTLIGGFRGYEIGFGITCGLLLGQPAAAQASPVLSFELPGTEVAARVQPKPPPLLSFAPPRSNPSPLRNDALSTVGPSLSSESLSIPAFEPWFTGGSDSLVARAVGSAEGTRTPQGEFTWAYHGHWDPGNGKWNLGSFSYQHDATSPEDADQRQLRRLAEQSQVLYQLAVQRGLELSVTEALNGIDLANQAPLAALDRGYIDWLGEARQLELEEAEGILYARTWSYWDPDLEAWNAPGLGNQWLSISEDQRRRQEAIAEAIRQATRLRGES